MNLRFLDLIEQNQKRELGLVLLDFKTLKRELETEFETEFERDYKEDQNQIDYIYQTYQIYFRF